MQIKERITGKDYISNYGDDVIYALRKGGVGFFLYFDQLKMERGGGFRVHQSSMVFINDGELEVYDREFDLVHKLLHDDVKYGACGISLVDKNSVIWSVAIDKDGMRRFRKNENLLFDSYKCRFFDENSIIHFPYWHGNSTHIWSTDIHGTKQWEYHMDDGWEMDGRSMKKYGDEIFFVQMLKGKKSPQVLIGVDSKTGQETWRTPCELGLGWGCVDPVQGVEICLRSLNPTPGYDPFTHDLRYSIANYKTHVYEEDVIRSADPLHNVNRANQYIVREIVGDRVYFADNRSKRLGGTHLGVFNMKTKEIESFEKFPEVDGASIRNMLHCRGHLFVLTSVNNLFVLEL